MFAIAKRLHQPVSVIERLSARELQGWVDYWWPADAAVDDGAIDMKTLSREDLRSMFPGR